MSQTTTSHTIFTELHVSKKYEFKECMFLLFVPVNFYGYNFILNSLILLEISELIIRAYFQVTIICVSIELINNSINVKLKKRYTNQPMLFCP